MLCDETDVFWEWRMKQWVLFPDLVQSTHILEKLYRAYDFRIIKYFFSALMLGENRTLPASGCLRDKGLIR